MAVGDLLHLRSFFQNETLTYDFTDLKNWFFQIDQIQAA